MDGFTLPDGAWMPPELIYLLPRLSGAELKLLVVILYKQLPVGGGEETSITDLENLTGMARSTVIATLKPMVGVYIERRKVGRSYAYSPIMRIVRKSDYSGGSVRKSDHKLNLVNKKESQREGDINSLSDSLDSGTARDRDTSRNESLKIVQLIRDLRSAGVYLQTAQQLVSEHGEEKIRLHLDYYEYALIAKFAQGPGWLVLSIKEDWPAPLGFSKRNKHPGRDCDCDDCRRRRYAEWDTGDDDDGEAGAD